MKKDRYILTYPNGKKYGVYASSLHDASIFLYVYFILMGEKAYKNPFSFEDDDYTVVEPTAPGAKEAFIEEWHKTTLVLLEASTYKLNGGR